jgi:hypothetical protein
MKTTTERKTCEQLIDDRLKDRLEDIRKSAGLDPDDEDSEDYYIEPSSISRFVTYKVELSGGGPADWFDLYWNGEYWKGGRYIYQDWHDEATLRIDHKEAEEIAEAFGIYPNLED